MGEESVTIASVEPTDSELFHSLRRQLTNPSPEPDRVLALGAYGEHQGRDGRARRGAPAKRGAVAAGPAFFE